MPLISPPPQEVTKPGVAEGLTQAEAKKRLQQRGFNEIPEKKT
jgi:hypothetical protein